MILGSKQSSLDLPPPPRLTWRDLLPQLHTDPDSGGWENEDPDPETEGCQLALPLSGAGGSNVKLPSRVQCSPHLDSPSPPVAASWFHLVSSHKAVK